jgi:hypothetical protein
MRKGGSWLGTLVVVAGVVFISWLALRRMTETQKALLGAIDAAVAAHSGALAETPLVPPIPSAIAADAGKQPLLRLDVVVRVDGLDVTANGAPSCRDGHKRLIGRKTGGAAGTFDEGALASCIRRLLADHPNARSVAVVTRAGPAVPTTQFDALTAALGRAGVSDVAAVR